MSTRRPADDDPRRRAPGAVRDDDRAGVRGARHANRGRGRHSHARTAQDVCCLSWSASRRDAFATSSAWHRRAMPATPSPTRLSGRRRTPTTRTGSNQSLVARAVARSAAGRGRPCASDARGLLVSQMRTVGDRPAHGRHRHQRAAAVRALAQRRSSSARMALPGEARLDAQGQRGVRVRRRHGAVLHSPAGPTAQSADRRGAQLR